MVAIDLPRQRHDCIDVRRLARLALAGTVFWLGTSVFFTALAFIDQAARGFESSPPYGFAGFLYGYASWIVLAPGVFLRARAGSYLSGWTLFRHAGVLLAGSYAVVLVYCAATQFAFHGLGPIDAVSQYSVFEWLWDGFLFGLVFLAGLRSEPVARPGRYDDSTLDDRIAVRSPDRVDYVAIGDILAVTAQGNYAALMLDTGTLLHRATLSSMARRMERAGFLRIHRSHIVHPDQIISATARGDRIRGVVLKNGSHFPVSATFAPELAARLHGEIKHGGIKH